ncbi:MAG: polymer-forming cytoskeletal protein [Nitrospinae bacterium]|nr:polymer-forming cytoskeletal protein [Nitrospinota bacterium]
MAFKKESAQSHIRAFLGEGTEFEGLLSFDGTVRIDGKFKGEINTDDCLIIGETGYIEAEIKAGHLIVMGTFNGNVTAAKKVEIVSTGKLMGNIISPALIVLEGGVIEGNIHMKGVADQLAKKEKVVNLQEVKPAQAAQAAGGKNASSPNIRAN